MEFFNLELRAWKKKTPLHQEHSTGCSSFGNACQPHHRCPMGCRDGSSSTSGFSCSSSPSVRRNASFSLFCCPLLTVFPEVPPAEPQGSAVSVVGLRQRRPGSLSEALQQLRGGSSSRGAQGRALCCIAGDQYCGGRLEKPSGSFHTPNWPERDYPAGVTCSWHIVAPKNQVRRCHRPAGTAQLAVPAGTNTCEQPAAHAALG